MPRITRSFLTVAVVIATIAGAGSKAAQADVQHWDVGRGSVVEDALDLGGKTKISFVSGLAGNDSGAFADYGCIEVTTSAGTDRGCGSVPAGGTVDDTLNSGTIRFTVPSSVHSGGTLSVNVTLAAYGSYSLDRPLAVDPGSPATIQAAARIVRLAVPSGGVTSTTVGGGLLSGDGGLLFLGSSVVMTADA